MNFSLLRQQLQASDAHLEVLITAAEQAWQGCLQHGDYRRWAKALAALPKASMPAYVRDGAVCVGQADSKAERDAYLQALQQLCPWRKGPWQLFDVPIDAEWRSDWKWNRLQAHIGNLEGQQVLDVGSGNGYYAWRLLLSGARFVVGIDPTLLFQMQFLAAKQALPMEAVVSLPIGIEAMPEAMHCFDTVLSMGVLYHRRSPIDHLQQLKGLLRPGGELVLETLVIEGGVQACLMPEKRYARMRNVWFLPSVEMLCLWLRRCGYQNIRCVDVSDTTIEEQRATAWMHFESLQQCLNPDNQQQTIEAYAAPKRAMILAEAA